MRHLFVCTTGYSDHWPRNVAEKKAHAGDLTPEQVAQRRREAPEHSDGHYGAHCGEKLGGDLYHTFRTKLEALQVPGIMLSPNACTAQHKEGNMVMVYPDGIWYHLNDLAEVDEIIESHLLHDRPVERLIFRRVETRDLAPGVEAVRG